MTTAAKPSLELLKDVPPEKLDEPCKDEHLCEIALSITDWQSIAPFLGLTEAEESDIEKNYDKAMIQKIKMLRKWREKFGRQATYRKLANVFTKLKHAGLVEELCDLIWQRHSSSSHVQPQDSHKLHSTSEVQSSTPSDPEETSRSTRCQYANTLRDKYQFGAVSCYQQEKQKTVPGTHNMQHVSVLRKSVTLHQSNIPIGSK